MATFSVYVSPMVNKVLLGNTATFECNAEGAVEIQKYSWNYDATRGTGDFVDEERFSTTPDGKILSVDHIKAEDNMTRVDCTAQANDGTSRMGYGEIFVLPSQNGTMIEKMPESSGIPALTVGGGVVMGLLFVFVVIAMFLILRWLKKQEIQKQQDLETARNRYSRISFRDPAAQSRARYDRDQGNVQLGGGYGNEEEADGDSYEDMLPTPVAYPPRSTSRSGQPRYGQGPRR